MIVDLCVRCEDNILFRIFTGNIYVGIIVNNIYNTYSYAIVLLAMCVLLHCQKDDRTGEITRLASA